MADTVVDAGYTALPVTTTTATGDSNARYILSFTNLDKVAQTATLAVTNNAGTTAGMPQIAALGASQVITYPAPGFPVNGFSVTASGTLTGPGISVLYRTNLG